MAICWLMRRRSCSSQFGMPAVDFLLRGGDQRIEQVVGLHAEALAARDLDVRLRAVFLADLVAELHGAARRQRDHLVGEVRVVRRLLGVAQQPQRLDHRVLRIALPRVDDVVDRRHAAEVRMVGLAVLGRDPHLVAVGIAVEAAIAEVASQQPELPEVIRDVLADVADRAVGAHDDLRVFVGAGLASADWRIRVRVPHPCSAETRWVSIASSPSSPCSCPRSRSRGRPSALSSSNAASQNCRRRISLSRGRKSYSMSSRSMVSRWRRRTAVEMSSAISAISLPPCSMACSASPRVFRFALSCSYHCETRA